jgi:hypothetical protein
MNYGSHPLYATLSCQIDIQYAWGPWSLVAKIGEIDIPWNGCTIENLVMWLPKQCSSIKLITNDLS